MLRETFVGPQLNIIRDMDKRQPLVRLFLSITAVFWKVVSFKFQ